jgi:hypothetical protein
MRYQITETGYQLITGILEIHQRFYLIIDFLKAIYIKLKHGTIPAEGQIKETVEIPIETLINALSTSEDEIKNYWSVKRKINGEYTSSTYNNNYSTNYKYFAVIYRPLLIIDYSSIFKYF